jgi:NADH:ubiquinone oxidoreductase subunit C
MDNNSLFFIEKSFPKHVLTEKTIDNELFLIVNNESLNSFLHFLKYHSLTQVKVLTDICCVDWIYKQKKNNNIKDYNSYYNIDKRFEIIYNLLSVKYTKRIFVKVYANVNTIVHSITNLYSCSNWLEREVWDMFGVYFLNHNDLRRILTDYGFEGYPLRKDFPLSGFLEVKYFEEVKRVISETITLTQGYRDFSFLSPWEIR